MENALSCMFMMENALSCMMENALHFVMGNALSCMMENAAIMMENALSFMMKKVILTQNFGMAHECDPALLNTETFIAL